MTDRTTPFDMLRDPRAWAADCRAQAGVTADPQARAAFLQLAEEFEFAASEIDGLVSTYDAMTQGPVRVRRQSAASRYGGRR